MKTTLNLDDELYHLAKRKALEEGRTVTKIIEDALYQALSGKPLEKKALQRVPLPSLQPFSPTSSPGGTQENEERILLDQEINWAGQL